MFQQFIDRTEELDFLNKKYSSGNPEFIILYGRRRVGKTEIIKEFIKNKPAIYFMADRQIERENLSQMKKSLASYLKDSLFEKAEFRDHFELFSEFTRKTNERVVFVIDEFQYLIESNHAIPSIYQKICDEVLSKTNIFLILCGSSISMMETLMGYKNPLYGRRTGQWKVEMLKFRDSIKFLPNYGLEQQVEAYSILDRIPLYLKQFDDIIEKIYPVTTVKERAKDTRYRLGDNFFSFWFRFIYPNRSEIERGELAQVMDVIKEYLNSYLGKKFEKICMEAMIEMNVRGQLPFHFKTIGGWWHKDREIDIIAINEDRQEMCFCECKWQRQEVGLDMLKELELKSMFVDWFNITRQEYFMVISRSGFTAAARKYGGEKGMLLYDVRDLWRICCF